MTKEEWTEPTQQDNSAAEATPTDVDDRTEKAAARQSIKRHIIQNQSRTLNRISGLRK